MTHEFTQNDWQQIPGGLKIEFPIEESNDKHIIQVYQTDGNTARIIEAPFIIDENILKIETNIPFAGYVVIK